MGKCGQNYGKTMESGEKLWEHVDKTMENHRKRYGKLTRGNIWVNPANGDNDGGEITENLEKNRDDSG